MLPSCHFSSGCWTKRDQLKIKSVRFGQFDELRNVFEGAFEAEALRPVEKHSSQTFGSTFHSPSAKMITASTVVYFHESSF